MTNRERFLALMEFETPDRLPNYELGAWGQAYDRWIGEGLPMEELYGDWFDGEPYLELERRGFAPINVSLLPPFDYEVLAEDERYITARNGAGIVTRALKEGTARGTRWCMDQYLSHPVTDRASFAAIKQRYQPHQLTRYPIWWDEWARIWATRDYPLCLLRNGSFGLYSQLRSWVGTENLSYLFYDDPAFVGEMIEFAADFLLATVERGLTGVQYDYFNFFEDFAGKGGPLLSPAIFRQLFLPAYQRIIGRLRQAGIKHFWLDSDGDPRALIPLMIEAGITCLWPLEVASGMDAVELRREWGHDLALAGGIDKREIAKNRAAIDRELERRILPLREAGGYLPHLDHTFPPDVSYDNLRYYLDKKRELLA
ncbi:MAG TPA: uroporphyrinogen decarboxylase family protein [Armatimonadota bacterium]|jgi:uroporphyrinogen decarboxylase